MALNAFWLKIIAALAMLIDHIGAAGLIEDAYLYLIFRGFGRIAFPLFAFLIARSTIKTSNPYKFIARLLLLAIISEIPFDLAFMGGEISFIDQTNIFYTLTLGVVAIVAHQKLKTWGFFALASCAFVAELLSSDFGSVGVLLIFAFYLFSKADKLANAIIAIIGIVILYWQSLFLLFFAALAIPLIHSHDNTLGFYNKYIKWSFYIFYPLHAIVLYAIVNFF